MGLFARAMPRIRGNKTMASLSDGDVKVAYALQLMREHLEQCKPMKLRASLDGKDISGEYLLFEAMNTRYIGPNLFLAPNLAHDGGLLDIVFVTEKDRNKLSKYLAKWQEGKLWPPALGVARGRRLEIEWTGFQLHIDDRVWPARGRTRPRPPAAISIELEPAALEFLVPPAADDASQARSNSARRSHQRFRRKSHRGGRKSHERSGGGGKR